MNRLTQLLVVMLILCALSESSHAWDWPWKRRRNDDSSGDSQTKNLGESTRPIYICVDGHYEQKIVGDRTFEKFSLFGFQCICKKRRDGSTMDQRGNFCLSR